jgi:hypothetical protein
MIFGLLRRRAHLTPQSFDGGLHVNVGHVYERHASSRRIAQDQRQLGASKNHGLDAIPLGYFLVKK